jgi:hypothetical protein
MQPIHVKNTKKVVAKYSATPCFTKPSSSRLVYFFISFIPMQHNAIGIAKNSSLAQEEFIMTGYLVDT